MRDFKNGKDKGDCGIMIEYQIACMSTSKVTSVAQPLF
jgi:hypothetical protein